MVFLLIGIAILLVSMAIVMGAPFVHFFKRDCAYNATQDMSAEARLNAWYQ